MASRQDTAGGNKSREREEEEEEQEEEVEEERLSTFSKNKPTVKNGN